MRLAIRGCSLTSCRTLKDENAIQSTPVDSKARLNSVDLAEPMCVAPPKDHVADDRWNRGGLYSSAEQELISTEVARKS